MIPTKLIVTARGEFEPGLAVLLRFKMIQKNDYSVITFLAHDGRRELTRNELIRQFDETARFSMMDYVNARGGFIGMVEAHVLSKEEIESALRAYEMFKSHLEYPPDYLRCLRHALDVNPKSRCTVTVEQIP